MAYRNQIYCPDNVWILTFNGLSADADSEPVTFVYQTRSDALYNFQNLVDILKNRYKDHAWFEDTEGQNNVKKIAFRLESVYNKNIMVSARRTKFITYAMPLTDDLVQERYELFSKGVKIG